MNSHARKAELFIRNTERTDWHDQALWFIRAKRDKAASSLPEWEELREIASGVKDHVLSHLDTYLEQFAENATANGAQVHWARDAEEHNRIILNILNH